jgi:hypothetical protein
MRVSRGRIKATAFKIEASATDIIELVLAFHAIGLFQLWRDSPATQKWLMEWAEHNLRRAIEELGPGGQ